MGMKGMRPTLVIYDEIQIANTKAQWWYVNNIEAPREGAVKPLWEAIPQPE